MLYTMHVYYRMCLIKWLLFKLLCLTLVWKFPRDWIGIQSYHLIIALFVPTLAWSFPGPFAFTCFIDEHASAFSSTDTHSTQAKYVCRPFRLCQMSWEPNTPVSPALTSYAARSSVGGRWARRPLLTRSRPETRSRRLGRRQHVPQVCQRPVRGWRAGRCQLRGRPQLRREGRGERVDSCRLPR